MTPDLPPVVVAAEAFAEQPIIIQDDKGVVEILRGGLGFCMRGPLQIFNLDGSIAYELAAGKWYPTGCHKRKGRQ